MTGWNAGYVADLAYTHGFYRELTPNILEMVALAKNNGSPDSQSPFNYCELGCGQGLTMNILAAANPHINFYATDFNPGQIAGARSLANDAGLSNVNFFDHSFANFADAPGLPDSFDIIALHGIYSWVSKDLQRATVSFIDRKLRVGGLVYVSYNCAPGWSAAAPMRHLMYLHGKSKGGPTISRLGPAIDFVGKMISADAGYFKHTSGIKDRFDKLKGMSRNYLAHEYFNDVWDLPYHHNVSEDMGAAKLSYVGSAGLLEHVDVLNITPAQKEILSSIDDLALRETARDYMVNQQFRRDVYVKGATLLSARRSRELWLGQRFALSTARDKIEMKVGGPLGQATLQPEIYIPLLDAFAAGPRTLKEVVAEPSVANLDWATVQQGLVVLVGAGHLQPCHPSKDDARRAKSVKAFNLAVIRRARDSADILLLASPVTGGGISVNRVEQLFLLAISDGLKELDQWINFAWTALSALGERLIKDGKPLAEVEANLAELKVMGENFVASRLPVLRQLQVV